MRLTRGDFNEIFLGAWCPHLQNLAGVNRPAAKCIDLGSQSLLVKGLLFNFYQYRNCVRTAWKQCVKMARPYSLRAP